MAKIYVIPVDPKIKVRDLKQNHIGEFGAYVDDDLYYHRRVRDGDLSIITDETQIKALQKKQAAADKKATSKEDA
jgi:hypothetical protein